MPKQIPSAAPYYSIYAVQMAHNFCADRIRRKLLRETDTTALLSEADAMVRRDIGCFPSEDPPDPYANHDEDAETERQMREILVQNYEALAETESYMWGLGIAGVFHQWERSVRTIIEELLNPTPAPASLDKLNFDKLCDKIQKTGFDILSSAAYPALRTACLIANTIKHGSGTSFDKLVAERRDLFSGGPVGVRMGTLTPQPHHLRVSQMHFDESAKAIDAIWSTYDDMVSRRP